LHDRKWKEGQVRNIHTLEEYLLKYKYSSFSDYASDKARPERSILGIHGFDAFEIPSTMEMLREAQ
jgi:hypothetical protein